MSTIEKVEKILNRCLTHIEAATIMELLDQFSEEVILEAMELAKDKKQPLLYFKKILYNIKNPFENNKPKPVEEPKKEGSEWLANFMEQYKQ